MKKGLKNKQRDLSPHLTTPITGAALSLSGYKGTLAEDR